MADKNNRAADAWENIAGDHNGFSDLRQRRRNPLNLARGSRILGAIAMSVYKRNGSKNW
jgi:hypothetical protein